MKSIRNLISIVAYAVWLMYTFIIISITSYIILVYILVYIKLLFLLDILWISTVRIGNSPLSGFFY